MLNSKRRQRLHELLLALIAMQENLPLMDESTPDLVSGSEPGRWLDQNRRTLRRYQALVRTAVTMDALMDGEVSESCSSEEHTL